MNVIPQSGVSWGFDASDILSNSGSLVSSVAGFVLLALAFVLAVRLVGFIRGLFSGEDEVESGWSEDGTYAVLPDGEYVKRSRLQYYYSLDEHEQGFEAWADQYVSDPDFSAAWMDEHYGSGWPGYDD